MQFMSSSFKISLKNTIERKLVNGSKSQDGTVKCGLWIALDQTFTVLSNFAIVCMI